MTMTDLDKKITGATMLLDKRSAYYESDRNQHIAHFSVHAERTGENQPVWTSSLSEDAADRLIFYGRQDSAHALLNTSSLLREVHGLKRSIRFLNMLVGVLVCVAAALLWRAW